MKKFWKFYLLRSVDHLALTANCLIVHPIFHCLKTRPTFWVKIDLERESSPSLQLVAITVICISYISIFSKFLSCFMRKFYFPQSSETGSQWLCIYLVKVLFLFFCIVIIDRTSFSCFVFTSLQPTVTIMRTSSDKKIKNYEKLV